MNISSRNQSSFSKLRNALSPPLWDNWGLERANDQNIGSYITLSEVLALNLRDFPITEQIDVEAINKFALEPGKRPQKILNLKESIKVAATLTFGAFIMSGLFLGISLSNDGALFTKLYVASILICLSSTLAWKISASRANRLLNQVSAKQLVTFARTNPAATKRISDFLKRLRNLDISIFVLPANGKIRKINPAYWNADNWEIGLVADLDARKAVALSGSPPSGEIMFLKSELNEKGLSTEHRTTRSEMMLNLEKVTTKVKYAFDPSKSKLTKPNNSTVSKSKNIYEELGLPRNVRWCPHLRAVQRSSTLIRKLVSAGDRLIRENIIHPAFIPWINAYRVLQENSQNWKSYRIGNLDPVLKDKLELKLRTALHPEHADSNKAAALLKSFIKPDNRPFNEFVASLNIVPAKSLEMQISLYKEAQK